MVSQTKAQLLTSIFLPLEPVLVYGLSGHACLFDDLAEGIEWKPNFHAMVLLKPQLAISNFR